MLIKDILYEFIYEVKLRNYRNETIESYESDMESLLIPSYRID
ncbi:hypothetical protein [Clostridium sp. C2-6-12]|nr:hypothetical protein [Clostridium sp. C2-6-12]